MIELRWKIEPLLRCDPEDNGIYGAKHTLQYRFKTVNPKRTGDLNYWSKWRDVPEVATACISGDNTP